MKDGTTTTGQAAYDEAMAQLREPRTGTAPDTVASALAAVDAIKTADLAFLSTTARHYGANSTPAANLRELRALRQLASAVRAERGGATA
jgi:hypothetical protein